MQAHYLIEMQLPDVIRIWSGEGVFTFDGEDWQGTGQVLDVGEFEQSPEIAARRMHINVSVLDETRLAALLQDSGPFWVIIRFLGRSDPSNDWTLLPLRFRGRASSPGIRDGVMTLELETLKGDVDRGDPFLWSHEDQQARFPGDMGFEHLRTLADEGIDTTWPP